jgi:hypothetical protein
MEEKKKSRMNKYVTIGFWVDIIGFIIAWFLWPVGIAIIVAGIVFTVIGLKACIRDNENVGTAVFYLIADAGFLVFILLNR